MKIHSNLDRLLKDRGHSKTWIAGKLNVNRSQVYKWCNHDEDGNVLASPHLVHVMQLMKILNCKLEDIFELIE